MNRIKYALFGVAMTFTCATQAELSCTGSAYGLQYQYTFSTPASGKDLNLHALVTLNGETASESNDLARYSSTSVLKMLGEISIQESYYIYVPDKESKTEIIGLSKDHKIMAISSPDPLSDRGNFATLTCSGTL